MLVVKMDKYRRICVPKEMRDRLGLLPNVPLKIVKCGDKIVLSLVDQKSKLKWVDGILVYTGKPEHSFY